MTAAFYLKTEAFEGFTTVPSAFAPHEVDVIRGMIEAAPDKEAAVVGIDNLTVKQLRDSRVRWLGSTPDTQWIFERVASIVNSVNAGYFGLDLTATESIQLTEYDSVYQGFYGAHTDSSYGDRGVGKYRKLSVTMQLSDPDDYDGGDLLLYDHGLANPTRASRAKGSMTLFRSHIIHEVVPVTRGTRYSFVTWVTGPRLR